MASRIGKDKTIDLRTVQPGRRSLREEEEYRRGYRDGFSAAIDSFNVFFFDYERYDTVSDLVFRFWNDELTRWFLEARSSRRLSTRHPPILRCARCGTDRGFEIDHILPKSRGGVSALYNYQVLCKHCNRKKYNHPEEDDAE